MKETRETTGSALLDFPAVAALQAYVRAQAEALRAQGFASLALFGSLARDEGRAESDVDVLYEFAPGRATLDAVLDLQQALETVTDRTVHLVSRRHLHPILRDRILEEATPLFAASTSGNG